MSKGRPWTVRAPYSIPVTSDSDTTNADVNELASNLSHLHVASTPVRPSPSSSPPPKRLRPARNVAPFLDNFVQPHEADPDRLFNTRSKVYFLPSDETEHDRLERQHTAFTLGFGGLYPCPEAVRAVLAPEDGKQKSILDLGTGTGIWAIEMAQEFPHATVLGVDLAPVPPRDHPLPSNCRFEIDDITAGLEHFAGSFDLVHARCLFFGVTNYRKAMEDISRCLKPGGLAIFIDPDMELLAEDRVTILPMALGSKERPSGAGGGGEDADSSSMEGSWFQRILYEARQAARINGSDVAEAGHAIDEGLWRMNMYDAHTCGASSLFTPLGPWPRTKDYQESQKLQYAGSLMRQDCLNLARAFRPLFLHHNVSNSIIDQWIAAIDYELSSQKFRCWVRLRIAWGRRKLDNNTPLPSCSTTHDTQIPFTTTTSDFDTTSDPTNNPSHQMEIYQSSEQSLMAKAARKSTRRALPVPFVIQLRNGNSISI